MLHFEARLGGGDTPRSEESNVSVCVSKVSLIVVECNILYMTPPIAFVESALTMSAMFAGNISGAKPAAQSSMSHAAKLSECARVAG